MVFVVVVVFIIPVALPLCLDHAVFSILKD